MKIIQLTQGKHAIVDDIDYPKIKGFSWYLSREKNGLLYAKAYVRGSKTYTSVRMHRLLLGLTSRDRRQVDHRNSNGLDNRRKNLRVVSNAQNSMNRRKQAGCLSDYKGVSYDKRKGRWRTMIMKDQRAFHLGFFKSETEAALAYNKRAKELFGEHARLNVIQ